MFVHMFKGIQQFLVIEVSFSSWILNPRKVRHMLDKIGVRAWIGPECEIRVQFLDGIRDWKGWCLNCSGLPGRVHLLDSLDWVCKCSMSVRLERAPCTISGGLKDDASGLHAFICMRRQGLGMFQDLDDFVMLAVFQPNLATQICQQTS